MTIKALLVEDNDSELERLKQLFIRTGYEVDSCTSSARAEELLDSNSYAVILLDVSLADKSSTAVFDRVRREGLSENVIIYTGNPSTHLKNRFLEQGAVAYILKGSPEAGSENIQSLLLRLASTAGQTGGYSIPLEEFIKRCLPPAAREIFWSSDNTCSTCSGVDFAVDFSSEQQFPSEIRGRVVCSTCQAEFEDLLD